MQINVAEYWLDHISDDKFRCEVAVVEPSAQITFGELFDRAGVLGEWLIHNIQSKGNPIAVFMPKSSEQIATDMAIIYSGNAYMNLDVKQPVKRTEIIAGHIKPTCIVTTRQFEKILTAMNLGDTKIIYSDDITADSYDTEVIRERLSEICDTDPLCIVNTSGSTGIPKGVVMNHRGVIDFIDQSATVLRYPDRGVIGSLSPVYFDIFTLEFYLTLWKGYCFVIVPESLASFPARLIEHLADNRVSFIFWVPTVMVNVANLDILASYRLPELKMILFAGEVFPQKHLEYWFKHLPDATFINMYGPIEITVDCLYHVVTAQDISEQSLPIGKAFPNTKIYILNDDNRECVAGERGELCVGGTSLAMGYYNDDAKTAAAFVQNPLNNSYIDLIYRTGDIVYRREDGNVMFVGRKDFQIKHYGYRIELGEIENVAVALPFIENACVLYDFDKKQIVLVYESDADVSVSEIRNGIGKILPKYMLPTRYERLTEMPRNPNGKIDRRLLNDALRDNFETRTGGGAVTSLPRLLIILDLIRNIVGGIDRPLSQMNFRKVSELIK